MIINNDPDYERKKAAYDRLNRSEDELKESLLNNLRQESAAIISLACIYAKKFEETGMDVTERWETAEQQMAILQSYFNKGYVQGYQEGVTNGKKMEREEMLQAQQIPFYSQKEVLIDYEEDHRVAEAIKNEAAKRYRKNPTKKKRRH